MDFLPAQEWSVGGRARLCDTTSAQARMVGGGAVCQSAAPAPASAPAIPFFHAPASWCIITGAIMELSRRIYPLDTRELTEEQLAVVFAMTSRNPQPFDEIARLVSEERAADFHERWVLNYGHASVAEHAVLHLAVENVSRLACDTLEDNRLASYTEKSSRYQVLERGHYHVPGELDDAPALHAVYVETCDGPVRGL